VGFAYQLHSEAVMEYANAYEWYERRQKGLGEKFIKAVDTRIEQYAITPNTTAVSETHTDRYR